MEREPGDGFSHGEVMGAQSGLSPIGRSGTGGVRGLKCRVIAADTVQSPIPCWLKPFSLAELNRMLSLCDTVLIACALAPETTGLIEVPRLAG
jgi:phosphoglycerate dehydrogenase-like enzyme